MSRNLSTPESSSTDGPSVVPGADSAASTAGTLPSDDSHERDTTLGPRQGEAIEPNLPDPRLDLAGDVSDPLRWLWPVVIVLAVLVTFGQTVGFDFLTWDDDMHVTANERFQPLIWSHLKQFWTEPYEHLYIPLSYTLFASEVWLSQLFHGADAALSPALFHGVSVLLHALNALGVLVLLRRWDHDGAAACAGALLFALHPLQVESVAWISEQRGLLSALLSLIAIWFYSRGERPSMRDYTLATIAFILAMLAKPSAVSMPLMAAAIDYGLLLRPWQVSVSRLVPWAGLSIGVMSLTSVEQLSAHIEAVPSWGERWWVAADALGWYVAKVFWPFHFSIDAGHSARAVIERMPTEYTVLSVMPVLLAAIAISMRQRVLAAAALITMAGLVPVLGFVPFAFQNISTVADRYAYLPMLGVGLAVSHMLARKLSLWRWVPAIASLVVAAWLSFGQTHSWSDSVTLYNHALAVNPQSWTSHHGLGNVYYRRDLPDAAEEHFRAALEIKPNNARSLNNLAVILLGRGDTAGAHDLLERAISASPWYADAHATLGNLLLHGGKIEDGIRSYRRAIAERPKYLPARINLTTALVANGQLDEALEQINVAIEIDSSSPIAYLARARIAAGRKQLDEAERDAKHALELAPRTAQAHEILGNLALLQEQHLAAITEYDQALAIDAQLVEAQYNRALALLALDRKSEAVEQLQRALRTAKPNTPVATRIRDILQQHQRP